MSLESLEERTVEVLQLPDTVDELFLQLYFENKRRSGGGPLVSVEKKSDCAILVFEDAEVVAQVLSRRHVLHNIELCVRKPATKDQCRILLRGIKPNTSIEMIELYVENMTGLNVTDFTLYPSPGGDVILIHLNQPLSQDFQNLSAKISKRTLKGANVTLEQIEQTDSILLVNLHPGTTPDMLILYFESKRGCGQKVKEVTMLSEGTAKVSFVNHESLGPILDQQHTLEGAELGVKPYFDFLQPRERAASPQSGSGSQEMTEVNSEELCDLQMQTSPPMVANSPSSLAPSQPLAFLEAAVEVMEKQTENADTPMSHIAVADPVKLTLFRLSPLSQDIKKAHPDFTVETKDDGVLIVGTDQQMLEQIKHTILECLGNMVEAHFTLEPENAQFLARKDVQERLLQTMSQSKSPSMYSVSDTKISIASLSHDSAGQTFSFLKSQICHVSIPLETECESMLYCREWSEFLQALPFSSVKVSEQGRNVDVLTLKGMESERQNAIKQFLYTPIEKETVIPMDPGMLTYMQTYYHQLLADMDQVSIFPLEADGNTCGLKIHGHVTACQMAEEVLQSVISSVCTKTITVTAPGLTRFLDHEECKSILSQMERRFQVYVNIKYTPWEHLPYGDFFTIAWNIIAQRNFQRVCVDDSVQVVNSLSANTDQNGVEANLEDGVAKSDQLDVMDVVGLSTAVLLPILHNQVSDGTAVDAFQSSVEGNTVSGSYPGLCSNLGEEAQLSLAIQYSMESSQWSPVDEEEQLKKALELSMIPHEASSCGTAESPQVKQRENILDSFQKALLAASTIQLDVFAPYPCDLTRVDIAFGKRVSQNQVEEKVEHWSLRKISDYHKMCLEVIKRKHGVEIQVEATILTISGFKDFVYGGMCDVKLLLENMEKSVSNQEILKTVQWVTLGPATSDTTPYSPDAIVFIENNWRLKKDEVKIILDNQLHIIDFEKMQERNKASGKCVKISRRLLDVDNLEEDLPEEEYSLLSNLPEVSKLDQGSDEFNTVVKNFYDTLHHSNSKIRIIKVEKLMNRLLYRQYRLKKASIVQHATYPEIERTLYHGTSEESVKEIFVHGFNRSFCGKNATVYGQGVYFAVNAALSVDDRFSPPNANGYKFVFVSKVLTGDFTLGDHAMKTAPLKKASDIPLRYDSVTDDITKPSMFVIFNDTQAFPEYLITCQKIFKNSET